MTPSDIETVKDSFQRLSGVTHDLLMNFYNELFHISPSVRPFFAYDLTERRVKLLETISAAVLHLHQLHLIEDMIVGLARRCAGCGVKPEHFVPVGHALIHALEKHSPGGLTPAEADAWITAYNHITDIMVEAMLTYAAYSVLHLS